MNNKPLLVFIPGTLCTSDVFMPMLVDFPLEAKIVEFNQHDNLSDMAAEVMRIAGGRPFIPVGFSMGGMVAFELMRMNIGQLAGIVLLNSNCHADIAGRKAGRDSHLQIAKTQGIETLIRQEYLPVYFGDPFCDEGEIVTEMAKQLGVNTFEAQLKVLAERPDSLNILTNFDKPLLIVGAQNDRPCPPAHQQIMAKAAAQSELHLLSDCGHFAPLQAPTIIANLIKQWVNKYYA
ncbi:MAG: pimeloyl-ACP methyl ester carboxylesterase [Glaciecola sp.]|jgi:pimeloyl-ACP methyl ester carboxylesterase